MAVLEFNRHSGQGREEVLKQRKKTPNKEKKAKTKKTKLMILCDCRWTCGLATVPSTWETTNGQCLNTKRSHMRRLRLRWLKLQYMLPTGPTYAKLKSQNSHHVAPKTVFNFVFKLPQNCPKIVSGLPQNVLKVVQSCWKVIKKNVSKLSQKWAMGLILLLRKDRKNWLMCWVDQLLVIYVRDDYESYDSIHPIA